MSILDRAIIERTNNVKPERVKLASTSLFCSKTGDFECAGLDSKHEYLMRLEIITEFWANQAQYESAYKSARRATSSVLFSDAISLTHQIRKAAMDDDIESVLQLSGFLEELFT